MRNNRIDNVVSFKLSESKCKVRAYIFKNEKDLIRYNECFKNHDDVYFYMGDVHISGVIKTIECKCEDLGEFISRNVAYIELVDIDVRDK